MPAQMLDLDGRVIRQAGEFALHRFNDSHGVGRSIEEIRIAECNVLGSRGHLPTDVLQHHLWLNDAKGTLIYRHHRTMPAQVLAPAARFGVARALPRSPLCSIDTQLGVFFERRQPGSYRSEELQPVERNEGTWTGAISPPSQACLEFAAQDSTDP